MSTQEPIPVLPGFDVRRRIAGGGMGEVFEAVHLGLARTVAIKRLRSDRLDSGLPGWGAWNARFRREARLLAAINHPNIATVHDILEYQGVLHLVMEYVDGHSLRDALRAGPLDLDLTLEVARQLATGLLAAHEAGVIHRDIKPENILINTKSQVKILDFGLARAIPDGSDGAASSQRADSLVSTVLHTRDGAFMGTPGYASPEQVLGEPVDQRTDVFSFGCVVFEMLCGQRPFDGRGKAGAAVVLEEEPAWFLLPTETPAWLVDLLRRCLTRAAMARPSGLEEVLATLEDQGAERSPESEHSVAEPVPNNLPRPLSSFVGRVAEASEVRRTLTAQRLVTLTGLGGAGKSRLASRIAEELVGTGNEQAGRDGVFLIRVAALNSPRQLPQAVSRAMGLKAAGGRALTQQITAHLGERHVLFVLDACEHWPDACRRLCAAVLEGCANVRILATSRERLSVAGEVVLTIGPMTPQLRARSHAGSTGAGSDGRSHPHPAPAIPSEAAQLFVERAREAWAPFEVDEGDGERIESICSRVGGLPLAIELAASLVEALSVEEIDRRLELGIGALAGVPSSDPRTLTSVIAWAHERLSPLEQSLLSRLSVFAGDFALDAAEAVCGDLAGAACPGVSRTGVLGALLTLVRHSLVVRLEPSGGASRATAGTRYVLLDPVREFSLERLAERRLADGRGELEVCRKRRLEFYDALIGRSDLVGPEQTRWFSRLEADYADIDAAMQDAGSPDIDPRVGLRVAAALMPLWYRLWMPGEGSAVIEQALSRAGLIAEDREGATLLGRAYRTAGVMAWMSGDRRLAEARLTEALRLSPLADDRVSEASSHSNLGLVLAEEGRMDEACEHHARAVAICRQMNDRTRVAQAQLNQSVAEIVLGRLEAAKSNLLDALPVFRANSDAVRLNAAVIDLADVHYRLGENAEGQARAVEALDLAVNADHRPGIANAIELLGLIAARSGGSQTAVFLLEFCSKYRAANRLDGHPFKAEECERVLRTGHAGGGTTSRSQPGGDATLGEILSLVRGNFAAR
jgi:non-specific serine/threonine protein kinase